MRRIIFLVTSPRLPAGLLTAAAWDLVRTCPVLTAAENATVDALRAAGARVSIVEPAASTVLAAVAENPTVIWLTGPVGDEPLAREVGLRLTREPDLAELELMYGSWDPVGARLLDVVSVMDRLASPGGDPWKWEQTHQTLGRYLLEEAYEAYDAIEGNDLDALREELGDVLLQVVLHARMAEEAATPWSIDDLAGDLVEKLVRRNPHVFADAVMTDVDDIMANWERIKQEEKSRTSALEGIAMSQPALALAAKILSRARRAAVAPPTLVPTSAPTSAPTLARAPGTAGPGETDRDLDAVADSHLRDEDDLGGRLFALVALADAAGLDPEAALRRAALAYADVVRVAEGVQPE